MSEETINNYSFELSTHNAEEADEICKFIDYLREKYPPKMTDERETND
jgi:hypothetical protein